MDLEECIARLVAEADKDYYHLVPKPTTYTRFVARRVIDGLGLIPDHRNQFNGHGWTEPAADRYVTPWAEQPIDDAPVSQAVADEMRARIDQITQAQEIQPWT